MSSWYCADPALSWNSAVAEASENVCWIIPWQRITPPVNRICLTILSANDSQCFATLSMIYAGPNVATMVFSCYPPDADPQFTYGNLENLDTPVDELLQRRAHIASPQLRYVRPPPPWPRSFRARRHPHPAASHARTPLANGSPSLKRSRRPDRLSARLHASFTG